MDKKKMYVITMSGGSYDDAFTNVVSVTDDYEKGTAYVDKMNSTYASLKMKMDSFYKNEITQWLKDNPRPILADYKPTPIPKWKSDEQITQEMRNERKKIELQNQKKAQAAIVPQNEWAKKQQEFKVQWMDKNLTKDEMALQPYMNENVWGIEEVPWLE